MGVVICDANSVPECKKCISCPFIEDEPYIFNTNLSLKFNVVADIA